MLFQTSLCASRACCFEPISKHSVPFQLELCSCGHVLQFQQAGRLRLRLHHYVCLGGHLSGSLEKQKNYVAVTMCYTVSAGGKVKYVLESFSGRSYCHVFRLIAIRLVICLPPAGVLNTQPLADHKGSKSRIDQYVCVRVRVRVRLCVCVCVCWHEFAGVVNIGIVSKEGVFKKKLLLCFCRHILCYGTAIHMWNR